MNTDPVCDSCGTFEVLAAGNRWLCEECNTSSGAGCAGGGEEEVEIQETARPAAKQVCHQPPQAG